MQQSPRMRPFVDMLESHDLVGEVLIVNNSDRPLTQINVSTNRKVRVIYEGPNLMVNPAWNLGAQHATYSTLVIANDDISMHPEVLTAATRKATRDVGIVGPASSSFSFGRDRGRPIFLPADRRTLGFGTLMAMATSNYKPIPDELKIWSGDDFLFNAQQKRNYCMFGLRIYTEMSTTSEAESFTPQKIADLHRYHETYRNDSTYERQFGLEIKWRRRLRNRARRVVPTRLQPPSWVD